MYRNNKIQDIILIKELNNNFKCNSKSEDLKSSTKIKQWA